ncbi:nucleoid-associated protein [Pedobacter glucosidilyticus]|uniref:nucleoid-associated protein n=1 Tax=Pedobacter glucosidilyticus TaxID=1122941 RepID=UPI000424E497|nr:nucleoid-associated protein [Pedobacter glucosidilyticus]
MITFFESDLEHISVHKVGNKVQDEYFTLSDSTLHIQDEFLLNLLMQYFLKPFEKVNEVYRFMHSSDLALNEIYHFASQIFKDTTKFHEVSQQITRHLYDISNHPKIKSGEVYIALFHDVQIEGELHQALGIFKSETKETYMKVYPDAGGFALTYEQEAINIQKLDKGCLILNTDKEEGYKVVVIDQTNKTQEAAVYWKDDFLKLKIRNDNFNQTNNYLSLYKNFVNEKIDEQFEVSKPDKIDLLNKSIKYFKEKEQFDFNEFSEEVIGNETAATSFKAMVQNFEQEFDTPIGERFDISTQAVKKQSSAYKTVLKLDKNFHVYIHGDRQLIENGFDDSKDMNYYKIYYKEEK